MSPIPHPPLLQVDGVSLVYRTAVQEVRATHQVSFDVHEADRFVLLGASGCGKSTLLKAIAGFIEPAEGEIRLDGQAVQGPGVCAGMGTANTMHIAAEALGFALPGSAPVAAMSESAAVLTHSPNSRGSKPVEGIPSRPNSEVYPSFTSSRSSTTTIIQPPPNQCGVSMHHGYESGDS